jgi:hypothetical protein
LFPDTVDAYTLTAAIGEVITVFTTTPFDHPSAVPANTLDAELVILHPDGETVMATDLDSWDGKNARSSFAAPVAGTYTIEVRATSGVGEYTLEIDRGEPNAIDDLMTLNEGASATQLAGGALSLLDNDIGLVDGPFVVSLATPPSHAADFLLNPDGTFFYEHDGSENFSDRFTYRVTDGNGQTDSANVVIAVTPVSDATPDAVDDFVFVNSGAAIPVGGTDNVLANDTGLDDTPIVISVETPPQHAVNFSIDADGTVHYAHDGSQNFRDSFVYRITDNDGESDAAVAVITPESLLLITSSWF